MPSLSEFSFQFVPAPFPESVIPSALGIVHITTGQGDHLQGTISFRPGRAVKGQGIPKADVIFDLDATSVSAGSQTPWNIRLSYTLGEDRDGAMCGWTDKNKEIRCQIISDNFSGDTNSKITQEEETLKLAKALGSFLGKNHSNIWPDATTLWCLREAYTLKTQIDNSWNPQVAAMLAEDQLAWFTRSAKTITKPLMARLLTHPDKDIRLWLTKVWQDHMSQLAAIDLEDAAVEIPQPRRALR